MVLCKGFKEAGDKKFREMGARGKKRLAAKESNLGSREKRVL